MRVTYAIDPELVAASVTESLDIAARLRDSDLAYWEKSLEDAPQAYKEHVESTNKIYDERVYEELTYYALVRVVKLGPKRFILVYGDEDDATVTHGTGPFQSLQRACEWFLSNGR